MAAKKKMGPKKTVEALMANDPNVTEVDLSGNISFQMKCLDYAAQFKDALAVNTNLTKLNLSNCNLINAAVVDIAEGIAQNASVTELDLSDNKFDNAGLKALGEAIATNSTLTSMNLMGHKGRVGEAALTAFNKSFETNTTLASINWVLESRQSFKINSMLTRNTEIARRNDAGMSLEGMEIVGGATVAGTSVPTATSTATATPAEAAPVAPAPEPEPVTEAAPEPTPEPTAAPAATVISAGSTANDDEFGGVAARIEAFKALRQANYEKLLTIGEEFGVFTAQELDDHIVNFQTFDQDGNMSLDANELLKVCIYMGEPATRQTVAKLMSAIDADNSGTVTFDEYLELMKRMKGDADAQLGGMFPGLEEKMAQAAAIRRQNFNSLMAVADADTELSTDDRYEFVSTYQTLDQDGNMSLDKAEFFKALIYLSIPDITKTKSDELFDEYDADSSGAVDFAEFLVLVKDARARFA